MAVNLEEEHNLSSEHAKMLKEFLAAEKFDAEDIKKVKEGSRDGWGGNQNQVIHVEVGPGEYDIAEDDDVAEGIALEHVRQDLEENPEIFNQDWLQSHIDLDHLRNTIRDDVYNSNYDYANDTRDEDRFIEEAERFGIDIPKPEDPAEDVEITDQMVEDFADKLTDEQLEDPISYLEDISSSKEEAMKQAMKWGGIDIEAATKEAVATDGWPHFLSGYDGNSTDLPSGGVYWRTD